MLKAGFIGFGRMGITHYSILNTHPKVKVSAVCDQSGTMLNVMRKYIDVGLYSDYQKMLNESDLDFVVVSTPIDSHAQVISAAIEKNLHIFAEKPLTLSAGESRETVALLGDKPLVNQVGYVNRFNEIFMHVKDLLDRGAIGKIKHFQSEMYGATVLRDKGTGWRGTKKAGGGCMYDFACHCIDLAIYLLGMPAGVTGSVLQKIYSSEVEDYVRSTFIYENGCIGSISANWSDETFRKPANIITIVGTEGKIIANKHEFKLYLKNDVNVNGYTKGWNKRYITDFQETVRFYLRGNEFTRQLDYFVGAVENRQTDNVSSFSEAYKTDLVMEEIFRDATQTDVSLRPIIGGATVMKAKEANGCFTWRKISNLLRRKANA